MRTVLVRVYVRYLVQCAMYHNGVDLVDIQSIKRKIGRLPTVGLLPGVLNWTPPVLLDAGAYKAAPFSAHRNLPSNWPVRSLDWVQNRNVCRIQMRSVKWSYCTVAVVERWTVCFSADTIYLPAIFIPFWYAHNHYYYLSELDALYALNAQVYYCNILCIHIWSRVCCIHAKQQAIH